MKTILIWCSLLFAAGTNASVIYNWVTVDADMTGSIEFSDAVWQQGVFYTNPFYPELVAPAILSLEVRTPQTTIEWPAMLDPLANRTFIWVAFGEQPASPMSGPPNLLVGQMAFDDFWMETINEDGLWRIGSGGTGFWELMPATTPRAFNDLVAVGVPEPGSFALLLAGLVALIMVRARRW